MRNSEMHVDGDVVGRDKNIFTTQLSSLPLSTRVAILLTAAVAVIALGVLVATHLSSLAAPFRDPEPMTGEFNIALCEFGQLDERGTVTASTDGRLLSKTIAESIANELSIIPGLRAQVRESVPLVRERDVQLREATVKQLSQAHNADLIIFGNLIGNGENRTFQPEFYVRGPNGAEEIFGSNMLGTPVGVPQDLSRSVPSQRLRGRIEALARFTLGLERLVLKDPAASVGWFEQAASTPGWRDEEGKEVLYLFLGTALKDRSGPGDFELARSAYQRSADLNPEYARAYIGLGNMYYKQFADSGGVDRGKLDQALAEYERADAASDKPRTASVEAKVQITVGNVYLARGQAGEAGSFERAKQEFERVIGDYQSGNRALADLVSSAYFGLGVVYERGYADPAQAANYYRLCLASAPKDPELRKLAETQLKIVMSSGAQPGQ